MENKKENHTYLEINGDYRMRELDKSDLEQFNALLQYAFQVTSYELLQTGWEQDEMQNTITRNGAIIAYRLMTVGLFVVMLVDIIAFGKNVSEFAILWFVCMVFEGVYRTIATYRAAKDDEENPPSKSALAGDIVKRIFIPVVIFADLIWKFWR